MAIQMSFVILGPLLTVCLPLTMLGRAPELAYARGAIMAMPGPGFVVAIEESA
jgi:hypothetical protein